MSIRCLPKYTGPPRVTHVVAYHKQALPTRCAVHTSVTGEEFTLPTRLNGMYVRIDNILFDSDRSEAMVFQLKLQGTVISTFRVEADARSFPIGFSGLPSDTRIELSSTVGGIPFALSYVEDKGRALMLSDTAVIRHRYTTTGTIDNIGGEQLCKVTIGKPCTASLWVDGERVLESVDWMEEGPHAYSINLSASADGAVVGDGEYVNCVSARGDVPWMCVSTKVILSMTSRQWQNEQRAQMLR
jgi:hypothetical protein